MGPVLAGKAVRKEAVGKAEVVGEAAPGDSEEAASDEVVPVVPVAPGEAVEAGAQFDYLQS